MPEPITRATLDESDFGHLVRGGTLRLGDVEFCLEDCGFVPMEEAIGIARRGSDRLGKVKEVGKPYDG